MKQPWLRSHGNCSVLLSVAVIQQDILKNAFWSPCKVSLILVNSEQSSTLSTGFSKTPCRLVVLEKPPVAQLLKDFPALYGTPKVHYSVHKSAPLVLF
jgi:hypothetical protein